MVDRVLRLHIELVGERAAAARLRALSGALSGAAFGGGGIAARGRGGRTAASGFALDLREVAVAAGIATLAVAGLVRATAQLEQSQLNVAAFLPAGQRNFFDLQRGQSIASGYYRTPNYGLIEKSNQYGIRTGPITQSFGDLYRLAPDFQRSVFGAGSRIGGGQDSLFEFLAIASSYQTNPYLLAKVISDIQDVGAFRGHEQRQLANLPLPIQNIGRSFDELYGTQFGGKGLQALLGQDADKFLSAFVHSVLNNEDAVKRLQGNVDTLTGSYNVAANGIAALAQSTGDAAANSLQLTDKLKDVGAAATALAKTDLNHLGGIAGILSVLGVGLLGTTALGGAALSTIRQRDHFLAFPGGTGFGRRRRGYAYPTIGGGIGNSLSRFAVSGGLGLAGSALGYELDGGRGSLFGSAVGITGGFLLNNALERYGSRLQAAKLGRGPTHLRGTMAALHKGGLLSGSGLSALGGGLAAVGGSMVGKLSALANIPVSAVSSLSGASSGLAGALASPLGLLVGAMGLFTASVVAGRKAMEFVHGAPQ